MVREWNDGTNYLMHHGIKGQKWGIRRFQNPDGSYTSVGKERYKLSKADRNRIQAEKDIERYGGRNAAKTAIANKAQRKGFAISSLLSFGGMAGAVAGMAYAASISSMPLIGLSAMAFLTSPAIAGAVNMFILSKAADRVAAIQDTNTGHDIVTGNEKKNDPQAALIGAKGKSIYDLNKDEKALLVSRAKELNNYETGFNDLTDDWNIPKNKLIKEYSDYLDDPKKWLSERQERLSKYDHY